MSKALQSIASLFPYPVLYLLESDEYMTLEGLLDGIEDIGDEDDNIIVIHRCVAIPFEALSASQVARLMYDNKEMRCHQLVEKIIDRQYQMYYAVVDEYDPPDTEELDTSFLEEALISFKEANRDLFARRFKWNSVREVLKGAEELQQALDKWAEENQPEDKLYRPLTLERDILLDRNLADKYWAEFKALRQITS